MLQSYIFGMPVNCEIMFSNYKNRYKNWIEKRQRSMVMKITAIRPFIEDGESILLITNGYSLFSSVEKYLIGWLLIHLKRSLFIFTDRRILHIPTDLSYSYRNSIVQIPYAGCASIRLKWGTLVVECPSCDHKDKYIGIGFKESKKIQEILKAIKLGGNVNKDSKQAYLCPRCGYKLATGKYFCEQCKIKFKSKAKARILSIMLPGGGYFYTRHIVTGTINFLLESMLYLWIALFIYKANTDASNSFLLLIIFILSFIFTKMISVCHSSCFADEFIPESTPVNVLKRPIIG